jgi:hypothetical protein
VNTARVTIKMGRLIVGPDRQPHLGKVTAVREWKIRAHLTRTFVLPAPAARFRVEVHVTPPFRPSDLAPQSSNDPRLIGAVVSYRFIEPRRTGR